MCWLQHLDPEDLKRNKKIDREQGLRLEEYRQLFAGMPPGLQSVNVVGGGEPLAHPQCADIMQEVKNSGYEGSIITNGSLLKESIAERMVKMRWNCTRVSVHAGDPETYQKIQGVDRFEIMRTNLKTFDRLRRAAGVKDRVQLWVFHVVQHENIPHIERLFEIAEEVGADYIEFDKIIPYDKEKVLAADELRVAQEALRSCAAQSHIPCNIGQIVPELQVEEECAEQHKPFIPAKRCSVGFDQACITSFGEVTPCCFSDERMGNIRERPFYEIWNGEKYREFRSRLMSGRFAKYCITNRCTLPDVLHN
jgi:MoaA/NifB/PqqE/SkfB family radical SAM enzyme